MLQLQLSASARVLVFLRWLADEQTGGRPREQHRKHRGELLREELRLLQEVSALRREGGEETPTGSASGPPPRTPEA
jgi:hypothetical protein